MCQRFTVVSRRRATLRMVASSLCLLAGLVGLMVSAHSQMAGSRKFQEFGYVSEEDGMARLDAFASELRKDSEASGFIIGYDTPDSRRGWFFRQLFGYRNYLVNLRGIAAQRIKVVDGGNKPQFVTELWLIPDGASAPSPGMAAPFEVTSPIQFDSVSIGKESECGLDPTLQLYELRDALRFFGEALRRQSAAKAWIVVHPRTREPLARTTRTVNTSKDYLAKEYDINPDRVLTAIGGHRGSSCTTVNLWIVPSNSVRADETEYYSRLMDKAEKNYYTLRRVEFNGNQYTRDNTLRRKFLQTEGDIFSRKALDQTLKSLSRLRIIYPVRVSDVEARLNREDKLIDLVVFFRERPHARRASKIH